MATDIARFPQDDDELWEFVVTFLGIQIPRIAVCPTHVAPFTAFADAFFARHPVTIWKASRGFGGKSFMLAALAYTEQIAMGAGVSVLGGSGSQSMNVNRYIAQFWNQPRAPRNLLVQGAPAQFMTELTNGGFCRVLMASQASVRGPHPNKLRLDEVDEMDLAIFDAAMGQPMEGREKIPTQVVASSTHQYPNGTMTELLKRAKVNGWPVYEFCWRENVEPNGWLSLAEVQRKRSEVTETMWCLPGRQAVIRSDGRPESIQVLAQGDMLLSGAGRERIVEKTWRRMAQESLVELRVQGLIEPIRLTTNHEVCTPTGKVRAGKLRRGDIVLSPRRALDFGGDRREGWLVGFYLAEGFVQKDRGHRVGFGVHCDEAERVRSILADWHALHPEKARTGFGSTGPRVRFLPRFSALVSLSSPSLTALLSKWTDTMLHAPQKRLVILPLQREFAAGVLHGWLDGDGCVTRQGWTGTTFSRDLAWQMAQLATDLGYAVGISRLRGGQGAFSSAQSWHVNVSRFRRGWLLPEKVKRVQQLLAAGESRRGIARLVGVSRNSIARWTQLDAPRQYYNQPLDLDGALGRRVKSVRRVSYTGGLYDVQVAVDHNYLAGGIAVSNSTEYDLQEPSAQGRAITPEAVEQMFDTALGIGDGVLGQDLQFEDPEPWGLYSTGADWGRKVHYSAIVTFRLDCTPCRVVAMWRDHRKPYAVMAPVLNRRLQKFPGKGVHDAMGVGDAVREHLTLPVEDYTEWQGKARYALFNEYIAAIEQHKLISPRIAPWYDAHRFLSNDDIFGSGHPPDEIAACALAWHGRPPYLGIHAGDVPILHRERRMLDDALAPTAGNERRAEPTLPGRSNRGGLVL